MKKIRMFIDEDQLEEEDNSQYNIKNHFIYMFVKWVRNENKFIIYS